MRRAEAAARGGRATLAAHGVTHFRRMAALSPKSGRPRRRTYDEIVAYEATLSRKAGRSTRRAPIAR